MFTLRFTETRHANAFMSAVIRETDPELTSFCLDILVTRGGDDEEDHHLAREWKYFLKVSHWGHFCIWLTSIHTSTETLYLFQARSHTNFSFLPNFLSQKNQLTQCSESFLPVRNCVPDQVACFALAGGRTELSSYHFSERCVMALYNLAKQNDGTFSSLFFPYWPWC